MEFEGPEMHLEAIALVRAQLTGDDEAFVQLLTGRTEAEIMQLIGCVSGLTAAVLTDFTDDYEDAVHQLDNMIHVVLAVANGEG
jgi:hypothetical protein